VTKRDARVTLQMLGGRPLLLLPLPPSVNERTIPVIIHGRPRQILSKVARHYIQGVGSQLFKLRKTLKGFAPIARRTEVDLWLILPRTSCDPHNYQKVLCDALEAGGFTTNDRFLIPRYRGEHYDKEMTQAVVLL
jgi:hypothetical protein